MRRTTGRLKKFGERGVVSITALNGYYAMLAMVLNVARTPILPANAQVPQLPVLPNKRTSFWTPCSRWPNWWRTKVWYG